LAELELIPATLIVSPAYLQEAQGAIDAITEERERLVSDNHERTIEDVSQRLRRVKRYKKIRRPAIAELIARAIGVWDTQSPAPTPPEGLEPDTIKQQIAELDATYKRRIKELADELADLERLQILAAPTVNPVYLQEAQAAINAMAEERGKLVSDDYHRTIHGVSPQLTSVRRYKKIWRQPIAELISRAISIWDA
jgi:outer membrane lipopolysaccharide assembly protein LptE/RlpB